MLRFMLSFLCLVPLLALGTERPGHIRLQEGWQFIRMDMSSPWEVFRPVKAGQPEIVPLWENVSLPHCFNATDAVSPEVNYYEGPGWYRTCLAVDNPYPDGRTLLRFQGAGQKTDVYLYTTRIVRHVGGYDSWTADITQALNDFRNRPDLMERFSGKIPVAIRCDNSRDAEMIPSDMSDFNIYGGLYRPVDLVYLPSLSVERLGVTSDTERRLIHADIYLNRAVEGAAVNVTVQAPDGRTIFKKKVPDCSGKDFCAMDIPVKRVVAWDVDHPDLYTISVEAVYRGVAHALTAKTGFRTYEFKEHGPFFLNNRRLLLQGTHRHDDHAGLGAAMPDSLIRKELKMIRDMGANFIRLGHYQQPDLVLALCDSLGILVWEEIPWCRGGLGGSAYREQARRMLTNMIVQHYNHPSVILWGLGNENDWPGDFPEYSKDSIRTFMGALNSLAHQLDATRKTTIRRCDFCRDITDVYSPTIWPGWYSGSYRDYRAMSEEAIRKYSRFLHAEWGGDSHAGRHSEQSFDGLTQGSKNGDWSESYMVKLFDWILHEQQTMPDLTGTAFWAFKDFSTPLRPDNPIPYVNQKGVVERDLSPKESYYVFQSYWSKTPMIHIYGHNRPVRWGREGESKEVLVYSNGRRVELFVNGVSQGIRQHDSAAYPASGLAWKVKLRSGDNVIRAVADGRLSDEIHQQYETRKWGRPERFAMTCKPLDSVTVLIEAQLVDAHGVRCLDAADWIEFGCSGDAMLLDNQGTSTGSRKIQAANGCARIKVRRTGGKAVVSASALHVATGLIGLE